MNKNLNKLENKISEVILEKYRKEREVRKN